MTNRTIDAYTAALEYVNKNIIDLNVSGIIIDFEKAMRAALKKVAPNLPILGCWFHFAQALRRRMASLSSLFALIKKNEDAKIIFRKFQCLALLPCDKIKDAFVFLLKEALEEKKFKEFSTFIAYFKKEWMEIVTPEYFSVFDKDVRTTGSAEAFNGKINKKCKTYSNFFNFVESLQKEELCKADEFNRHINGTKQPDRRKNFYVRRNEMIKEYSKKMKNGDINYKYFLNIMSNDENQRFYDEDQMLDSGLEDVREISKLTEENVREKKSKNAKKTDISKGACATRLNNKNSSNNSDEDYVRF